MAREIFVDASAWIALADRDDNYHLAAARVYPRLLTEYQRLVTTTMVVSEVYIALRRKVGLSEALEFIERTRNSPRISRIFSDSALELEAETILRRYVDHDISYVDAVSFALMQAQNIHEAFTFDQHFLVMGFQRIP